MILATEQEIVDNFISIPLHILMLQNWGKDPTAERWDVNPDTYIGGLIVMIDQEYAIGYVIEVVDRTTDYTSYAAIVIFDQDDPQAGGPNNVVWQFLNGRVPDSFVGQEDVAQWGVKAVFGMMESYEDAALEGS